MRSEAQTLESGVAHQYLANLVTNDPQRELKQQQSTGKAKDRSPPTKSVCLILISNHDTRPGSGGS
jgi:hypothetical protein